MPRTIQDSVDASGEQIEDDDLVNFGSCHRKMIDPSTGRRSYWFRYGDIRGLTLPQVQAAIGEIAFAGQPGRAVVIRVSGSPIHAFVLRAAGSFFGLEEYTIDAPVVVKLSIDID